jgi:hypothetical protein
MLARVSDHRRKKVDKNADDDHLMRPPDDRDWFTG